MSSAAVPLLTSISSSASPLTLSLNSMLTVNRPFAGSSAALPIITAGPVSSRGVAPSSLAPMVTATVPIGVDS